MEKKNIFFGFLIYIILIAAGVILGIFIPEGALVRNEILILTCSGGLLLGSLGMLTLFYFVEYEDEILEALKERVTKKVNLIKKYSEWITEYLSRISLFQMWFFGLILVAFALFFWLFTLLIFAVVMIFLIVADVISLILVGPYIEIFMMDFDSNEDTGTKVLYIVGNILGAAITILNFVTICGLISKYELISMGNSYFLWLGVGLSVLLLIFIYGLTKNNEPKLTKVFIGIYALAIVIFFVVQAAYGALGMILVAFCYWFWQALDRANKKKKEKKKIK